MWLFVLIRDDFGSLKTSFGTGVAWSKIATLGELLAIDAFAKMDEDADANEVFLLCRDGFPPVAAFDFDDELDFDFVAVTPGRALHTRISTRSPG